MCHGALGYSTEERNRDYLTDMEFAGTLESRQYPEHGFQDARTAIDEHLIPSRANRVRFPAERLDDRFMLSFDSRMSGGQSVLVAHFTSDFYTRELSLLLSTRIRGP